MQDTQLLKLLNSGHFSGKNTVTKRASYTGAPSSCLLTRDTLRSTSGTSPQNSAGADAVLAHPAVWAYGSKAPHTQLSTRRASPATSHGGRVPRLVVRALSQAAAQDALVELGGVVPLDLLQVGVAAGALKLLRQELHRPRTGSSKRLGPATAWLPAASGGVPPSTAPWLNSTALPALTRLRGQCQSAGCANTSPAPSVPATEPPSCRCRPWTRPLTPNRRQTLRFSAICQGSASWASTWPLHRATSGSGSPQWSCPLGVQL